MSTTGVSAGIYRINVVGGVEPVCLTRQEGKGVTILPCAQVDSEQEWHVAPANDGNVIIERPSKIFPTSYLTYEGAPEEGNRIVYLLSEFPPNEWHLTTAPGFRYFIHVAGSDLGIRVAPPRIFPPFLELGIENQLEWVFERVRDE